MLAVKRDITEPSVSAVITSYCRPEFLVEAVDSALSQTYPLHEVIVVDDGSPVSLEGILQRFGGSVVFERLEENSGANVARNRGVSVATGDYIAFLDDDDIWGNEKIEKQLAAMGFDCEACLCGFQDGVGGGARVLKVSQIDGNLLRQGNNICGTSGLLARREVIFALKFDPVLKSGQDWDMYVRLFARRPITYVAEPLFMYRHGAHSGLTTAAAQRSPKELEDTAAVLHKHREWLGERAYRRQLAAALLKYIGLRRNKFEFVAYAIRRAGMRAVASHLLSKLFRMRGSFVPREEL